jgi:hypothetical protein
MRTVRSPVHIDLSLRQNKERASSWPDLSSVNMYLLSRHSIECFLPTPDKEHFGGPLIWMIVPLSLM